MSKVGLVVEAGKHLAAKASALGAGLLMEGAADPMLGPSLAFTKKMREIGHAPLDIFNHTGNFAVAAAGGFMAAWMGTNAQHIIAKIRHTEETVSLPRINRVRAAAGVAGGLAASYALEKLGGSVDYLDVVYSLGMGALGASLIRTERTEVYDPEFWRARQAAQAAAESADLPQTAPELPGQQPALPPEIPGAEH